MQASTDRLAVLFDHRSADAFCHLADNLTEVIHLNLLAVMVDDAPEPVHKARVALRRLRACLKAFAPLLDDDFAEAMQDRARSLFRLLGMARDADVLALRFAGTERAAKLEAEAAHERQKMRKHLKRKKAEAFRPWVLRRLAGNTWRQTGKRAKALREAPVSVLAAMGMERAWKACIGHGPDLRVINARAQHDLRKDLKTLRYLTEFFADLWPGIAQERFLDALRALQDDLGEITDSALARERGHPDEVDTKTPQDRAAMAWQVLQAEGPWWHEPQTETED